jgi:hypothetical protein
VPSPFPAPFPTLNFNPKPSLAMVEASNITNPKITNLQKPSNSSSFYRFFTGALSQKTKKHNLILKIFSLSQQPSKSQTFKFLEFL